MLQKGLPAVAQFKAPILIEGQGNLEGGELGVAPSGLGGFVFALAQKALSLVTEDDLRRGQPNELPQRFHIGRLSFELGGGKFARGDIDIGDPRLILLEDNGGQVVIALLGEEDGLYHRPRGDDAHHFAGH